MELGAILGSLGTILGCIPTRKKYGYSWSKALVYSMFVVILGIIECRIMSIAQSWLLNKISDGVVPTENSLRFIGVIIFEPIIILLLVYLSGEKYRKLMDFAIPGNIGALAVGKIACHIQDCCYGIPYEQGIYNDRIREYVFPVQLCEAITSLLALATVYILLYKCKNIRKGSLFPIGSIVYCITRFIWEEFRYYDNEWQLDFFMGLNTWQFWCVVSIVTSIIWLIILYSNPKYAECSFKQDTNAYLYVVENKLKEKWNYFKHRNDKNIVHHKQKKK